MRWEHWQTRYCDILSRSIQQVCWWRSIRNQISRGVRGCRGRSRRRCRTGLTALAIGVSPVYALVIGAACGGMDLLPGFFAGYLIGYVMKYTEKYVPDGVDLIGSVVLLAPLARLIAAGLTPVVNNTLLKLVTLFKVVQTRIQYLWGLFSAVSLQLLVLRH